MSHASGSQTTPAPTLPNELSENLYIKPYPEDFSCICVASFHAHPAVKGNVQFILVYFILSSITA
jgi:hypothetical protein